MIKFNACILLYRILIGPNSETVLFVQPIKFQINTLRKILYEESHLAIVIFLLLLLWKGIVVTVA